MSDSSKTIIVEFGVPESVYNSLCDLAAANAVRLDQLLTMCVGAGLVKFLPLKG